MRRLLSVLLPLPLLLAAACASASTSPPPAARTAARAGSTFTPWPTFHRTTDRAGHATAGVGTLTAGWTKSLGGAVYGEPLVVGTTLIVATEGDQVYGLNARTGHVRWRTSLGTPQPQSGLPCGDIDPLGVTGTPAYDAGTGSVFAVAETLGGHHTLWALNAATGHKRWHRSLDVLPDRNRFAQQERSAVLVEGGRVVVSFGGLAGDCDNYVGYVTSTPTSGQGAIYHYAVPTAREAGMWSTGGPVLGRNGHVYVASGNGAATSGRWDKRDSVTELSPVRMHRLSAFAPSLWQQDNLDDRDLGSMTPMSVPGMHRIVTAGKRGTVYLLREHLGGVGSQVTHRWGCKAYSAAARVGRIVLMPCLGADEIRALRVGHSHLHWLWTTHGVFGSPVVAGSRAYVADRYSGDLVVLSLSTGHMVQRIHAGSLTHFPSEVVDGGYVFVPTLTGITAFHG